MNNETPPPPPVERLFPLALKFRLLLVGRETIRRAKSRLHFVLITRDISENSRREILNTFMHYPVVQHYTAADIERHFALKGTKVIGFKKSALAQAIYAELKPGRINKPFVKPPPKSEDQKPAADFSGSAAVSTASVGVPPAESPDKNQFTFSGARQSPRNPPLLPAACPIDTREIHPSQNE
jgi:hypothetical protein